MRHYINNLSTEEQSGFAERCGTTIGYLRKAISLRQRFSDGLAIAIERESNRAVLCEDLRPDIDWAFIRGTSSPSAQKAA